MFQYAAMNMKNPDWSLTANIIKHLQTTWKVKLSVGHHSLVDGNLTSEKPLAFVLDNRKNPDDDEEGSKTKKRKKDKDTANRKGNAVTYKNFGAFVQTSKLKASTKLLIGWRVRPQVSLVSCWFSKKIFPNMFKAISGMLHRGYVLCFPHFNFGLKFLPHSLSDWRPKPMARRMWSQSDPSHALLGWWIWTKWSFVWCERVVKQRACSAANAGYILEFWALSWNFFWFKLEHHNTLQWEHQHTWFWKELFGFKMMF